MNQKQNREYTTVSIAREYLTKLHVISMMTDTDKIDLIHRFIDGLVQISQSQMLAWSQRKDRGHSSIDFVLDLQHQCLKVYVLPIPSITEVKLIPPKLLREHSFEVPLELPKKKESDEHEQKS